ncbi:conserved protein of unknown function [Tenacibaculum sp. 190130A14a]
MLNRALSDEEVFYSDFVIDYDSNENTSLKTNTDDIMNYWLLPKIINVKMNLTDVCNSLVSAHNEMPLWIKLEVDRNEKLIRLLISKRFRKLKVIQEWHKNNDIPPIIKQ